MPQEFSVGNVVDPDPSIPEVQKGFEQGAIKSFARHSRLGATQLGSVEQVREDFMNSVEYLRGLGFNRVTLKTGSYGMEELAMAIKFSTDAQLDLLTIDGSGGGTGMSPWNMMQSWGVPSIILHSKAHEYANMLAAKGKQVVDMSFAGGFALEDHIFKALAHQPAMLQAKWECYKAIMLTGRLRRRTPARWRRTTRASARGGASMSMS